MRLHHLSLRAFGPFAEPVDIDFDALSAAGLFLVHGPTGAGKTSLLDAVCFALYAAVPGARPAGRALRSDHAGADDIPSVTLEFTAAGRRFRVTRSPEFVRPKKRGIGDARTPAKVLLHELVGGSWVASSSRNDEAGAVIRDVLGMGLEQFSKVVLLPQGDFAAFLRSTPEGRRALLEKLFDISAFTGVEEWLVAARRARGAKLEERRAVLAVDLARLADVVARMPGQALTDRPGGGEEPPAGPADWASAPLEELPALLGAVSAALSAHAGGTLAEYDAATARASAADEASIRAVAMAELQRRGATAAAALADLERLREVYAADRRRLDAAERAAACAGDLRALQRAGEALRSAGADSQVAAAAVLGLGLPDLSTVEARRRVESMTVHDIPLNQARRLLQEQARVGARAARADDQAQLLSGSLAEVAAELDRATAESRTVAARSAETEARAAGVEPATARMAALEALLALRRDLDASQDAALRAAEQVATARTLEQDTRELLLDRRQARLDGMAGELAERLRSGQPCVVCGSREHPAPAVGSQVVRAEDVEAAEEEWSARRAELSELEQQWHRHTQHARTRRADLDGEQRDAAALAAALAAARADVAFLAAAAAEHAGLAAAAAAAGARVAALTERRTELREQQADVAARVEELGRTRTAIEDEILAILAAHGKSCPCARAPGTGEPAGADGVDLQAVWEAHQAASSACSAQLLALSRLAEAQARHAEVAAETLATLARHGFDCPADAEAARLDEADLGAVRRQLKAADDRRASADATLSDPQIRAARQLPVPDLAAIAAAAEDARAEQLRAREQQALAERADREFQHLHAQLLDHVAALGPATADFELLDRLADTVSGLGSDNALRMRLSSFVLAARLEKVADLANERLTVMGDGRYRLQHSDELAGRGQRSGLGLHVMDLWTGQTRDTATLSGGESFMASLALALALADAVREEAGGFDLQTLFVDEGFGTLDEESLEQVMSVLDDLRDGGRAVGVVSHVSDLRSRIPCQVRVTKRPDGSAVEVVGAGAPAA